MNMIVAVDENWGIGKNNKLLGHFPEDLQYFKEKTLNKIVVMGSNTFKSLPNGPLPNRVNVVLSRNPNFKQDDVSVLRSVDEVLKFVSQYNSDDVFIIGGESIYKQFLSFTQHIYVTKIQANYNADTFFPNLDRDYVDIFSPRLIKKINSNSILLEFWEYKTIHFN